MEERNEPNRCEIAQAVETYYGIAACDVHKTLRSSYGEGRVVDAEYVDPGGLSRIGMDFARKPDQLSVTIVNNSNMLVSIGPSGDMQLPVGEAFTRSTVHDLIATAIDIAVKRDREHRAADGWVRRADVPQQVMPGLGDLLVQHRVPKDHGEPLLDAMWASMHAWAGNQTKA